MTRAYVFPGQGSQAVGMGRAVYDNFAVAREVFGEVDEALSQNLTRLIFDGPEESLTLTENAQPALMAVSLAVWRVLAQEGGVTMAGTARYAAGHSLGEYSALAAAGSLGLADTAQLLKTRGRAMQNAVPPGEGGMAAVVGVDLDKAREMAEAAGQAASEAAGKPRTCEPANDNAPGQVVISGHADAIEQLVRLAPDMGAKKVVPLAVSAPFHSPLMAPAQEIMEKALNETAIARPGVPIVCNVSAEPTSEPESLRSNLVKQVTGAVRWRESVARMAEDGVDELIELGSGKTLSGMAKRINRRLAATPVNTPDDIEALLKKLG